MGRIWRTNKKYLALRELRRVLRELKFISAQETCGKGTVALIEEAVLLLREPATVGVRSVRALSLDIHYLVTTFRSFRKRLLMAVCYRAGINRVTPLALLEKAAVEYAYDPSVRTFIRGREYSEPRWQDVAELSSDVLMQLLQALSEEGLSTATVEFESMENPIGR